MLTPRAALVVGLVFVASGVFPMLAAFDIGPLSQEDINGPPWLGFAAGGVFAAAGLAVMAGSYSALAARLFGLLSLAGLAMMGNWIAFGAGERACSGGISLSFMWSEGDFSGLGCRIPFGLGALITDAFLGYMVIATLQKALGGPPRLARLLKVSEWLIVASISPFILLLAVIGIGGAVLVALKERVITGVWPRNEEFIARQKARGLLGRFGRKPPAGGGGDSA